MTHRTAIAAALALGLATGAMATLGFAAPSRPAYVVIEVDQVTDAGAYDSLKMTMAGIVETQSQDGRYLARTENIEALDGAPPKGIVVIEFASAAKARAYYENTNELTATRMRSTKSRAFIVNVCSVRGPLSSDC